MPFYEMHFGMKLIHRYDFPQARVATPHPPPLRRSAAFALLASETCLKLLGSVSDSVCLFEEGTPRAHLAVLASEQSRNRLRTVSELSRNRLGTVSEALCIRSDVLCGCALRLRAEAERGGVARAVEVLSLLPRETT